MKHFKLIGPETTREFDIEENEMTVLDIVKISQYELSLQIKNYPAIKVLDEQNVKIYATEKE